MCAKLGRAPFKYCWCECGKAHRANVPDDKKGFYTVPGDGETTPDRHFCNGGGCEWEHIASQPDDGDKEVVEEAPVIFLQVKAVA